MFDVIPGQTTTKLWPHQRKALAFAINHLKTSSSSPCLVRMPTGTGKTGVIACLARLSNSGSTLVLTPWAHLRDQMIADLTTHFWSKIGVTPKARRVVDMLPSTAAEVLS